MYDRVTDRSRGFGFVTMASVDEAKEAIRMYDGAVSCRFSNLFLLALVLFAVNEYRL